jgi:RNA polymerase sigma-70 factor, ECF subfamily
MKENYRKFYSKYKDKLFHYLLCKSRDPEVAEDLVQDSFIRHFQHYGFQKKYCSPTLLFTIARHVLIDYQRYRSKRYTVESSEQPATISSGETSMISKEEVSRISNAFNKIPEKDRTVFIMAINGIPYERIAKHSDVSVGCVKVRVHRSRKKLQKLLLDEACDRSQNNPVC